MTSGSAGRRVTIIDVAARAGVSKSLASVVMRGAPGASPVSRETVLRAAQELGYQPDQAARRLREQRSRLLGVVIDPGDAFHADLLEALYPAAERFGYDVVLSARLAGRVEERAVTGLLRSRCEGLILLGSESTAAQLQTWQRAVRIVLVARKSGSSGVDAVLGADERGAAEATAYLIELGHRHIRFIDGGRRAGAAERRRGYRSAMRHRGLTPDVVTGDHSEDSGTQAARQLLDGRAFAGRDRVTAVFASNDRCAIGLLDTLRYAGIAVPQQVSVMGYDDSRLARLPYMNLTTVAQDAAAMARQAVGTLIERLAGLPPPTPGDILLEPRLVVRGTTSGLTADVVTLDKEQV